jgi:hypothetical protein
MTRLKIKLFFKCKCCVIFCIMLHFICEDVGNLYLKLDTDDELKERATCRLLLLIFFPSMKRD